MHCVQERILQGSRKGSATLIMAGKCNERKNGETIKERKKERMKRKKERRKKKRKTKKERERKEEKEEERRRKKERKEEERKTGDKQLLVSILA